MENPERSEIKVFDYDHGTKDIGVRRYIWIAEYDYVLILQKKKRHYSGLLRITWIQIGDERSCQGVMRKALKNSDRLNNSVGALFVTAAGMISGDGAERELALPRHREINEYTTKAILREAGGAES